MFYFAEGVKGIKKRSPFRYFLVGLYRFIYLTHLTRFKPENLNFPLLMQKKLKQLFGTHHGLDEKSVNFLTKALEKNNLPGFDYIEYKQSLGALSAMDIEGATAFKSAYATAQTVGLTKEKLLQSAEHYKKILNKEKEQFDAALEKQIYQRVKSKMDEVAKLRKQIEQYKAKVQELEQKIAASQGTIDKADETIQAAKDKIEGTKQNFEYTLQSIVNQIDKDIENINLYL